MSGSQECRHLLAGCVLLLVSGTAPAAGHSQCEDCHAAGSPSGNNLQQPLSGLCIRCHQARMDAGEHAIDIPVPTSVRSLPFQAGRMTCITCHDPHAAGRALRMIDPLLCEVCH